jgi:hypothetical protein
MIVDAMAARYDNAAAASALAGSLLSYYYIIAE